MTILLVKIPVQNSQMFFYLYVMQLFSVDATMFKKTALKSSSLLVKLAGFQSSQFLLWATDSFKVWHFLIFEDNG